MRTDLPMMNYGMQLRKWTLIILVKLLRYISRTSLTWWHNVDVSEIMPFTDEDKHFIKILRKEKVTATVNLFVNFLTENGLAVA